IGDGPTCCFNGSLDQIKIYNRSLTVSQIQKNFELGQIGFDNNMTVFNETRSGEVWTAYAVPIDARGFNGTNFTNSVTIQDNTAPTITASLNETNATLTTLSDINGTANYSDSNGDTGTVYFTWFVNDTKNFTQTATSVTSNINVSRIFTQDNFSKGHTIILEATPYDGTTNGTAVNTSSLTVQNIAPQITIGLNETNATLTGLSDINATANYTDRDSDSGTVYFTWFVNDTKNFTQTATSVSPNINVSRLFLEGNFSKGYTIILEATPYDGATNGTPVNTSSLTVGNLQPSISVSVNETNATLTGLSDINATANYTDSDSDTGTVYFTLYRNGTSLITLIATSVSPNINVSRIFLEGNFSKGHAIILEATPYDGVTNGTARNTSSFSLTVQNIAPQITIGLNETNATLTSLSDINGTANYTDTDSDTGTVYFTWYINDTKNFTQTATSVSPNINVSRIFLEGNFSKGHAIILEATPYDGVTNGTARNTSSLTRKLSSNYTCFCQRN
ncbi:hypothetical protein HYY69_00005, partial [Candidatus Woesearchaeota archaeon]|nr:hypothetical protein [Candidatus Woesearchaeota archaeon]